MQIRRNILSLVGDEATATSVMGANFTAGFVAGTLAAAATCPLDVAKTRRQIEVFSVPKLINMHLTSSYLEIKFNCRTVNISSVLQMLKPMSLLFDFSCLWKLNLIAGLSALVKSRT